jgi:hypothetical protein
LCVLHSRDLDYDTERQGRWNDILVLQPYTGERLQQLLSFIGLLLPFTKESNLHLYELEVPKGKSFETIAGHAKLIEMWTGGILRDIMILIVDASLRAIDAKEHSLSPLLLQKTWEDIKNQPVVDIFKLLNSHRLVE